MNPIDSVLKSVQNVGVDVVLHLPCGKIAPLLDVLTEKMYNIPVTREEEGVGIAAGASLAYAKPLMVIQNSGIGNMVNAIMSLTKFYELPLPIFVSHRGIYKENIPAQIPMGQHLEKILDAMDVEHFSYNEPEDVDDLSDLIRETYEKNVIRCFLFSPKVWEGLPRNPQTLLKRENDEPIEIIEGIKRPIDRIAVFRELEGFLEGKAVICNMGFPSRELYFSHDQESNFYMLGSLGLASSMGLGVSLFTKKEVVVIDGDGSLLMNPNALILAGAVGPPNLTILCLDNGTYGSTGDQPTWAGANLLLEELAKACGIEKILVSDDPLSVVRLKGKGPRFIRLVVKPGNADVGTVGLGALEIKKRFSSWLRA